jgi:hypothetical protein
MIKGTIQAATEQAIHEAIDRGDDHTLDAYAEHAATWMDADLCQSLAFGVLKGAKRGTWPEVLAFLMDRAPALALAVVQLDQHIDKHRAEFMEDHAQRVIAENQRMKEDAA